MKKILVTGATGNIGFEVIRYLHRIGCEDEVVAGVRSVEKAKLNFVDFVKLGFVQFDFEDTQTFDTALDNIDTVFLLRPPQISDVEKYFRPLLIKMKEKGIHQILFLSVQGVQKSKLIPHHKIEKLIESIGFEYIFLRPSYFMQNLTTTFAKDIQDNRKIILPAGKAKFNWIDAENIGEIAAILLAEFSKYKNKAFDLTGSENLDFYQAADLISQATTLKISYQSVNPIKFYKLKKKEGVPTGLIMVMIMLHFLPRFQKEPVISDFYEKLTGKKPTLLKDFIFKERSEFIQPDY